MSCVLVTIDGVRISNWIYWPLIQSARTYKEYSAIADLHNLQFTVTHALRFPVSTSHRLVTELKVSLWLNLLITHLSISSSVLFLPYLQLFPFSLLLLSRTFVRHSSFPSVSIRHVKTVQSTLFLHSPPPGALNLFRAFDAYWSLLRISFVNV
jgi:hypothetical protein